MPEHFIAVPTTTGMWIVVDQWENHAVGNEVATEELAKEAAAEYEAAYPNSYV
jgi:hypothetical protein